MRLWSEILQVEDTLFRKIFNHYRPELHYMRGPGPKWLEKHSVFCVVELPMKKVERSRKSIQLPLRIDASRSFILKPNIILGNSGNGNVVSVWQV